ncbi:heme exporter protein CcmD [Atlantibacter sp.]|uniref:heme exporter protein CcmD n=1 Tax=Atlantibacter sp. TaxID=1903473 RepID=UPI0013EF95A8|nr:heme exporter protein CcmD [Atlantibacter sp.]
MNVAFGSVSEFFAMGGYAFYVWLAVAFTVIPLGLLVVHTLWQRNVLLADIRRQQGRERRIKDAQHPTQEVTG